MTQLNQALDLFSEGVIFSEQYLQLCLGICGLLPYANEHWISHLAECGEVREHEQQRGHDELFQQLYALYQKIKRFQDTESYGYLGEREPWMAWLNPYPEIQAFIHLLGRPGTDGKAPNGTHLKTA